MSTQLFRAIERNNLHKIKKLISSGINISGYDVIYYASLNGNSKIIKFLVSNGADITVCNHFAIRHASEHGYLEIVKFLVSKGANINAVNDYAVRLASKNGHLETVKFLVSKGADITAHDHFAIVSALEHGHFETVKFLVSQGADINCALRSTSEFGCYIKNRGYFTKLAVERQRIKIVKYLISQGADINLLLCKWKVNECMLSYYNDGDFDNAIKLSAHPHFTNKSMKKILTKIQHNRTHFFDAIRKNYCDLLIIT